MAEKWVSWERSSFEGRRGVVVCFDMVVFLMGLSFFFCYSSCVCVWSGPSGRDPIGSFFPCEKRSMRGIREKFSGLQSSRMFSHLRLARCLECHHHIYVFQISKAHTTREACQH